MRGSSRGTHAYADVNEHESDASYCTVCVAAGVLQVGLDVVRHEEENGPRSAEDISGELSRAENTSQTAHV